MAVGVQQYRQPHEERPKGDADEFPSDPPPWTGACVLSGGSAWASLRVGENQTEDPPTEDANPEVDPKGPPKD